MANLITGKNKSLLNIIFKVSHLPDIFMFIKADNLIKYTAQGKDKKNKIKFKDLKFSDVY